MAIVESATAVAKLALRLARGFRFRVVSRSVSRSVSRLVKPRQRRRLMASQHGFAAPTRRACASFGGVYAGGGRWHARWGGHGLVWPNIGVQIRV